MQQVEVAADSAGGHFGPKWPLTATAATFEQIVAAGTVSFFRCAAGCDFDVCVACVVELRGAGAAGADGAGKQGALPDPGGDAVAKAERGLRSGGGGCG